MEMQSDCDIEATSTLQDGITGDGLQEQLWPEMEEWIAIKMSHHMKAKSFLELDQNQKLAYIRRPGPRPLFGGLSMTMCLMQYYTNFLQFEKEWVEMLLKAEMHFK